MTKEKDHKPEKEKESEQEVRDLPPKKDVKGGNSKEKDAAPVERAKWISCGITTEATSAIILRPPSPAAIGATCVFGVWFCRRDGGSYNRALSAYD